MIHIFVISDGTGQTATQTLQAALTQFPSKKFNINLFPEVRNENEIHDIITQASEARTFVIHTVVSAKLRKYIIEMGKLHNVETIDLMGPLLARLTHQLNNLPSEKPGLFRQLNEDYFQRIEAMEFVLRHDDGQRVHELNRAEIVLVGVSRTFKTPLSIFLAFKGWMVANVPIILNMEPPEELDEIAEKRVFALTTDARTLTILRRARDEHLGHATGDYATFEYVRSELHYAQSIFSRHPKWQIIDVTHKPIEEIASRIINKIHASP